MRDLSLRLWGLHEKLTKAGGPPPAPYKAILLCDRFLLNRHVILYYTIPKPYIHWKGMLLSRHQCWSCAAAGNLRHFLGKQLQNQTCLTLGKVRPLKFYRIWKKITFQCIYGFGMLRQSITGFFKQF